MSQTPEETEIFSQVLVIGGGVSGLVAGLAAAQAGFHTIVTDGASPEHQKSADSRAFALAPASMRLFTALGIGDELRNLVEPVRRMAISTAPRKYAITSSLALDFQQSDLKADGSEPIAYIIENKDLKATLLAGVQGAANLELRNDLTLSGVGIRPGDVRAHFADGSHIDAQLIIGADGRNSQVRNLCAIGGSGWSYGQTAIAATIAHAKTHDGIAQDIFMKSGPLGVLPLRDKRSSIVWCETPQAATELMRLEPEDFRAELETRLAGRLGAVSLEGQRAAFPLSLFVAEKMIAPRVALIADAAHAVHPLAGQGLNIGLRDIAALVETLVDAQAIGLDIGAETTLERYQRWRRFDNLSYAASLDALNRMFALQPPPLRALRAAGLTAVNNLAPLRKMFVKEASGLSAAAPRLLRGEALNQAAD